MTDKKNDDDEIRRRLDALRMDVSPPTPTKKRTRKLSEKLAKLPIEPDPASKGLVTTKEAAELTGHNRTYFDTRRDDERLVPRAKTVTEGYLYLKTDILKYKKPEPPPLIDPPPVHVVTVTVPADELRQVTAALLDAAELLLRKRTNK